MVRRAALLAGAILYAHPAWSSVTDPAGRCDLLGSPDGALPQTVDSRTLVELSDFGIPSINGAPSFSFSPSGHEIAIAVRRADTKRDRYCVGVVVARTDAAAAPRVIATGGGVSYLPMHRNGGISSTISGTPLSLAPEWSPDGASIAYLRQDGQLSSIWKVRASGTDAAPVATALTFVEAFSWDATGSAIRVEHHPEFAALDDQITAEGRRGFHYDDRYLPISFDRPMTIDPQPATAISFPVGRLPPSRAPSTRKIVRGKAADPGPTDPKRSRSGMVAQIADRTAAGGLSPPQLTVSTSATGHAFDCDNEACRGAITGFWWDDHDDLLVLKRDGWGHDRSSLYRRSTHGGWSRILSSVDWLGGCRPLGNSLYCEHETALHPRTVVRIDLADGALTTIFDPNPGFSDLRVGRAQRLEWRNRFGVECYGDLVLPPDHVAGQKHPLIIVQYESWGFLRGGTGDAYPIQTLAAHGFAVLSFQRPPDVYLAKHPATPEAALRIDTTGWADRENILSALETGIGEATKTGTIDTARIGLSGLSDGVATAQYALVHSRLFSVVALSGCCEDETSLPLYGPALTRFYNLGGYPLVGSKTRDFWQGISLAANAGRITQPILIQAGDSEFRAGLYTYASLRAQGRPIDMYVFPDEPHIRVSPAHRLAAYERAVQWFDYWLLRRKARDPVDPGQYTYWKAMKPEAP